MIDNKLMNIAVFLQSRNFFGAQIVHIPFLREIKKIYPNSYITVFSKHKVTNVLKSFHIVDEIVIEENKFNTFKKYKNLSCDITYSLRKQSFFVDMMVSFFNHNKKIGFQNRVTKLFFTDTLKHNVKVYRAQNYLNLLDKELTLTKAKKVNKIVILPGAGDDFKIWNIENYLNLAKELQSKYSEYEICFVYGKKEEHFTLSIKDSFSIYFDKPVGEINELISSAKFVIGNDTGPAHFAQISDANTLILFSDEKGDAMNVVNEWFCKKESNFYIIGDKDQTINTINVKDVLSLVDKYIEV